MAGEPRAHRVHGGGRALLLQVAHPLVAAGVEQHSNYEADPWGRLYGTLDTVIKIVFGDAQRSEEAAARLRRRHDRVKGVSEDGVAYDAHDPELLLWVWATLVDTARLLYERCVRPLSDEERERYYQEQKLFAYACGVPEGACPAGHADFVAYFARTVADELRVTSGAQAVAHSLVDPPIPRPLRPLFAPAVLVTAGLLPPAGASGVQLRLGIRDGSGCSRRGSPRCAGRCGSRRERSVRSRWS